MEAKNEIPNYSGIFGEVYLIYISSKKKNIENFKSGKT